MAYFGKYRGIVRETIDPEKRGRIRVECPAVLGKQLSAWALPNLPPFVFSVPPIGSLVWIEFEGGRIDSPIWTGVFYTTSQWAQREDYYCLKSQLDTVSSTPITRAQYDTMIANGTIVPDKVYYVIG